jgi:ornithine cyclodeaminase
MRFPHHAQMLILSEDEVRGLLDLGRLVDALGAAMASLSAGRASVPQRIAAMVEGRKAFLAAMPAYVADLGILESKLVAVFPTNADLGVATHQAVIVAFDPATGEPRALMDGRYITESRTAAGSALATRLLSRPDSQTLAVLGTGVQAEAHLRAIPMARSISRARVAGRDRTKAGALADRMSRELGIPIDALDSFEAAMDGADIVSACTHSPEPVVRREWAQPGMHITSVGVNAEGPEVDVPTVADSLLVVESRAAALAPFPSGATELRVAIEQGAVGEDHIYAEVGELVAGIRPGRTSPDQITLYKSVGVAVQDAAAAALVLQAAAERGIGTSVEL